MRAITLVCAYCPKTSKYEIDEDLPSLYWECPCGERNIHIEFVPFEPFEHIPGSHNVIRDGDNGIGKDRHG